MAVKMLTLMMNSKETCRAVIEGSRLNIDLELSFPNKFLALCAVYRTN